jgi:hypothetical protein
MAPDGRFPLLSNSRLSWIFDQQLWLELFVTSNIGVLAADIYLAHSVNQFRRQAEYIPFYFSLAAPLILLLGIGWKWLMGRNLAWRWLGYLVAWPALLIGLAGVIYHLDSRFFADRTLKSLTYAAPFAAPLAYTGLGFLLLVNRMVDPKTPEWPRWVLFLALGGFMGNFVLSLTDHAANGFFAKTEWIPVISSALAVGFLVIPLLQTVSRRFLDLCLLVLLVQASVGILGFWFHLHANLFVPGHSLLDKFIYGAPPMAPLLFPNLVGLSLIGLWTLLPHLPEEGATYLGRISGWFANQHLSSSTAKQ